MRVISSSQYNPAAGQGFVWHSVEDVPLDQAVASALHMLQSSFHSSPRALPRLLAFRIAGPAICLGRFQNIQFAFPAIRPTDVSVITRLTGGPALFAAPGTMYFCLLVPSWQRRIHPSLPQSPVRVLNKALSEAFRNAVKTWGLMVSETATLSFTRQGLEIARMGMDIVQDTLVAEWFLAAEEKLEVPSKFNGNPPTRQELHPTSGCLRELGLAPLPIREEFARALGETLLDREHGFLQTGEFSYLDRTRIDVLKNRVLARIPPAPEGAVLHASFPHEESIGFVQAQVAFNNRLQFSFVRLCGDFVADSPGIAQLEAKLRFTDVNKRNIALIIDDVLGQPNHFILGVKRLGTLLEAIMEAAAQNDAWNLAQN